MPAQSSASACRASHFRAAVLPCVATLAVLAANSATARELTPEVYLCSQPAEGRTVLQGSACAEPRLSSALAGGEAEAPRITFGRAADLVGRPVNYLRPIRSDLASATAGLRLAGMMPSRMPVAAYGLTSSFGLRQHPLLGIVRSHAGVDLAAPVGSPIFATSDGRVSMADWRGGYGLFVSLDHGAGIQTRYGHMSRLNVASGQQVRKGDVIGFVGSTGQSTGPHLHYEVRLNGQPINPMSTLKSR